MLGTQAIWMGKTHSRLSRSKYSTQNRDKYKNHCNVFGRRYDGRIIKILESHSRDSG